MKDYGETPTENDKNDIFINFETKRYKIILYIDLSKLTVKLEPENNNSDNIFQNSFLLSELKNFNVFFCGFSTLEMARDYIIKILKHSGEQNSPKIQRNGNDVSLIINMFGEPVTIYLKKKL